MLDMPYFMENEKWFYFDGKKRKFVLTKEAPSEAKKSYQEYYKELEKEEEVNGNSRSLTRSNRGNERKGRAGVGGSR